ncbi:MAG: hemerythrin domain-containing protein [Candidatus Saccharibacteria bacterium]|nr:hemerythrin domain-containing protein [Rhodoferax sp.]
MNTTPAKTAQKKPQEATALLRADHELIAQLFSDYESSKSNINNNNNNNNREIVANICKELSVHAQVEEEIFYPVFKKAMREELLVPEATVEHATLNDLIAQEGEEPDGEMFDAKIKVLSEYMKHHVKEEQNEMFPKAKASEMDLVEMGVQIAQRKQTLISKYAESESLETSDALGSST